MKKCSTCKNDKSESEFYFHSDRGHRRLMSQCKRCHNERMKKYEKRNWSRVLARKRRWNAANSEVVKAKSKKWREANPGTSTLRSSTLRRERPHVVRAHQAVSRAIKNGVLRREPCVNCGGWNSQAHHEDYSKPLSATWLCQRCHAMRHQEINHGTV